MANPLINSGDAVLVVYESLRYKVDGPITKVSPGFAGWDRLYEGGYCEIMIIEELTRNLL